MKPSEPTSGSTSRLDLMFQLYNVNTSLPTCPPPPPQKKRSNKLLFQTHLWLAGAIVLEKAAAVLSSEAPEAFVELRFWPKFWFRIEWNAKFFISDNLFHVNLKGSMTSGSHMRINQSSESVPGRRQNSTVTVLSACGPAVPTCRFYSCRTQSRTMESTAAQPWSRTLKKKTKHPARCIFSSGFWRRRCIQEEPPLSRWWRRSNAL